MQSIKRKCSPSHTKKKTHTADIKKENDVIAKQARVFKLPDNSISKLQMIPTVNGGDTINSVLINNNVNNNISFAIRDTTTDVTPPTTIPSPNMRNNQYDKITNHKLKLSFRLFAPDDDIHANMLPHISKEINGNFNIKYKLYQSCLNSNR